MSQLVIVDDFIPDKTNETFNESYTKFINATQVEIEKSVNPGGYYKAIWCRDASFILKDQFLTDEYESTLKQILLIWANQIGKESYNSLLQCCNLKGIPLLYGRGSPELGFKTMIADEAIKDKFDGALPTTIYYERGFCEVYGQYPDIDSAALMIYVTSWILSNLIDKKNKDKGILSLNLSSLVMSNENKRNDQSLFYNVTLNDIIKFLVPRMLKSVSFLLNKDIDNDWLLEQKHNEDWMDTLLRTG